MDAGSAQKTPGCRSTKDLDSQKQRPSCTITLLAQGYHGSGIDKTIGAEERGERMMLKTAQSVEYRLMGINLWPGRRDE